MAALTPFNTLREGLPSSPSAKSYTAIPAGIDLEARLTSGLASGPRVLELDATQQPATGRWWLSRDFVVEVTTAAALILLSLGLEKVRPRYAYLIKDTLYWHTLPLKDNSVPSWSIPVYSILGPLLIFIAHRFIARRPNKELARLILAFLVAYFLTGVLTNCLKLPIGRLRPNFVRHCWPNGTVVLTQEDQWGGYAVCDASVSQKEQDEVRKSFPSGHSSLSAAGLGFVTFFLLGQLRVFASATGIDAPTSRLARFVVAVLPGMGAVAVAVTRVIDGWHFPSDVVAGLALGFACSLCTYLLLYPPFTHRRCNLPWEAMPADAPSRQQGNGRVHPGTPDG